jgi:competence protein ComEA
LSRLVVRVMGSRFAKPIARIAFIAAGLVTLTLIGRTGIAGALGSPPPSALVSADAAADPTIAVAGPVVGPPPAPPPPAPVASRHGAASAESPVILNAADENELRRLPGIGEKRANAILSLRARLGRFRAVEDLLKVKGIGRATIKRLRPLLRLDAPSADAGAPT